MVSMRWERRGLPGIKVSLNWSRTSSGISFTVLGLVLLANTLGWVPWKAWASLLVYWPLLVVAAGVELALRKRVTPALWLGLAAAITVLTWTMGIRVSGFPPRVRLHS